MLSVPAKQNQMRAWPAVIPNSQINSWNIHEENKKKDDCSDSSFDDAPSFRNASFVGELQHSAKPSDCKTTQVTTQSSEILYLSGSLLEKKHEQPRRRAGSRSVSQEVKMQSPCFPVEDNHEAPVEKDA